MQYNISGLWQQSNLFYQKERLQLNRFNYSVNVNKRFKLSKQFSIELSGCYQSPAMDGILIRKGIGSLDVGIRKKLGGNLGKLMFAANNILNTIAYILRVLIYLHRTWCKTFQHCFQNILLKLRILIILANKN